MSVVGGRPRRRRAALTTRVLLVSAAIGVAFGVVGILDGFAMSALFLYAPAYYPVLSGVYLLPGVVAQTLLRRPGVGLMAQGVAGLVAVPANSALLAPTLAFLLYGAILELPFLVIGYRRWTVLPHLAAALAVAVLAVAGSFALIDAGTQPPLVQLSASVAIAAAAIGFMLLGRAIGHALRRRGVTAHPPPPGDRRTRFR